MAIYLIVSGISLIVAGGFAIKLAEKSYIATNTLKPKALPRFDQANQAKRWDF